MKLIKPGFRGEMLVLYYAVRHRSAPLLPKLVALLSLGYLLSPIDLIPDFIPVAGWLDDLVMVPLLLHLSFRLMPPIVVQESRLRARGQGRRVRRVAWIGLAIILALMGSIYWYIHSRH